jgi:pyrroloquinoline quinone biosynthesis protein D
VSLSPTLVPRLCSGVESSWFGQDFVVLNPAGTVLRGLNGTAARILALVDGRRTVQEISAAVAREYDQPAERVLPEVLSFFDQLVRRELVEPAQASSRP